MSFFKTVFAARCPQCKSRLHYTGWDLPYPQYICKYCVHVEQLDMDISIVHKGRIEVRNEEEVQLALNNFERRRKIKQTSALLKKGAGENPNTLYICNNFSTKSSICDRCRCNIWHMADKIESFEEYRECYETTIFEIKPLT